MIFFENVDETTTTPRNVCVMCICVFGIYCSATSLYSTALLNYKFNWRTETVWFALSLSLSLFRILPAKKNHFSFCLSNRPIIANDSFCSRVDKTLTHTRIPWAHIEQRFVCMYDVCGEFVSCHVVNTIHGVCFACYNHFQWATARSIEFLLS